MTFFLIYCVLGEKRTWLVCSVYHSNTFSVKYRDRYREWKSMLVGNSQHIPDYIFTYRNRYISLIFFFSVS